MACTSVGIAYFLCVWGGGGVVSITMAYAWLVCMYWWLKKLVRYSTKLCIVYHSRFVLACKSIGGPVEIMQLCVTSIYF